MNSFDGVQRALTPTPLGPALAASRSTDAVPDVLRRARHLPSRIACHQEGCTPRGARLLQILPKKLPRVERPRVPLRLR